MSILRVKDRLRLETLAAGSDPDAAHAAKVALRLAQRLAGRPRSVSQRLARRRGQDWQREVAEALATIWPDAHNNAQYRGAEADGADVEGAPLWVEAKNDRSASIDSAWRQATADRRAAGDDRPILLALQRPVGKLAVVELGLLVELLQAGGKDAL